MKKFKKMMAIVLSLAVVLAFSVPAMVFAEESYPMTINNANATADHTYTAYQVFAGTLSEKEGKKFLQILFGVMA